MTPFAIELTDEDRIVLESYKVFSEGLSNYLGSCYEIVVHSLENLDQSAIQVFNGYHTNRKPGAPITDLALHMLAQIKSDASANYISYYTTNKAGDPLRSTTIAICGSAGRIIGLMCINFYLNSPLNEALSTLYQPERQAAVEPSVAENFAGNIDELISKSVAEACVQIQNNPHITPSVKNREIISILNQQGIFNLKDGVIKVAEVLGISKNTVYLHLRNLSSENEST